MKAIAFFIIFFFVAFAGNLYSSETDNLISPDKMLLQTPKFNTGVETGTPLNFSGMPEISIFNLFFKVALTLIIVLIFFYIVRKIIGKRRKIVSDSTSDLFQTLAVYPMTANKSLQLIEFSDEIYLFGVSENNISLIEKINDKDKIDTIKLYTNMENAGIEKKSFFDFFVNTFSKKYKKEYSLKDFKKIDDYE